MTVGIVSIFSLFILLAFWGVVILALIVVLKEIKKHFRGGTGSTGRRRVCPQCGKPVKDGQKFCTDCGAKIE